LKLRHIAGHPRRQRSPFPQHGAATAAASTVVPRDRRATARQRKDVAKSKLIVSERCQGPASLPRPRRTDRTRTDGDGVTLPAPVTPPNGARWRRQSEPAQASRCRIDVIAYIAAVALAVPRRGSAFGGMVVLFPGSRTLVIAMADRHGGASQVGDGRLACPRGVRPPGCGASSWSPWSPASPSSTLRGCTPACRCHVGRPRAATSAIETQDARWLPKIDVQAHKVTTSTGALARSTPQSRKPPSAAAPMPLKAAPERLE